MVQYYKEKGKYGVQVTEKSRVKWFKTKKEGLDYVNKWSNSGTTTPKKKTRKTPKKCMYDFL